MKKPKAHLYESDVPLGVAETVKANCGEQVERAIPLFMWDETAIGESLAVRPGSVCGKCADAESSGKRYVYGIRQAITARLSD
jgi:hypothetical protein